MKPSEHLRILGPEILAWIDRRVADVPPPPPETVEALQPIFAPALARVRVRRALAATPDQHAA